jgi:uncharacterized membrane protein YdbT with pleckstrin-like domain
LVSSSGHVAHGAVVWYGKPWVVPAAVVRTVSIVLAALLVLFLEMLFSVALIVVAGLTVYLWTLLLFALIWIVSLLDLLFFWASHSYLLRQDGIEIRSGIIRLHSFVVTPSGFGDLMVYQSLGGRIFGYGEITVNSQGERQTRLRLVRSPFTTADTIRDIMGKPIVRVEDRA